MKPCYTPLQLSLGSGFGNLQVLQLLPRLDGPADSLKEHWKIEMIQWRVGERHFETAPENTRAVCSVVSISRLSWPLLHFDRGHARPDLSAPGSLQSGG